MTTTLETIYARQKAKLGAPARREVEDYIRRERAIEAFAFPPDLTDLEAQTGFIQIEREFSGTPVHLFGQDVASLAHSMVRVFRAQTTHSGDIVPGNEIFAARMSEKALTEMILLSNRATGQPMTVTRLGACALPARAAQDTKADLIAQEGEAEARAKVDRSLATMRDILASGVSRPNADLRDLAKSLGLCARNLLSSEYTLESHLSAMTKMRSEVLTEAAYAALHSQRLGDVLASGAPRLESPRAPSWDDLAAEHPMVHHALDPLTETHRESLRIMIVGEIQDIAARHPRVAGWIREKDGKDGVIFPKDGDRSYDISLSSTSESDKRHADRLSRLWNWAFNPHIQEDRPMRRADQACVTISQRSGWLGDIHSSLPAVEGFYFTMAINAAWEEVSTGSNWMRSQHQPLLELDIVAEDLMTALRGHPEGHPVPCSLRKLCGLTRPLAKRPDHAATLDIQRIAQDIAKSPEAEGLRQILGEVLDLVTAKRSGKAWREELLASLDKLSDAFEVARGRTHAEEEKGRAVLNAHVVESAENLLRSIARQLPGGTLELLRIGKN